MMTSKIQFKGELGEKTLQKLKNESIVWLTTVSRDGTPQPNPVWFLWDGETCLIYSQPEAVKVHNIKRSSKVSLHFEGASLKDDYVIILAGEARVDLKPDPVPEGYRRKYKAAIKTFGMTWEQLQAEYSAAISVRVLKYRGFSS